MNTDRILTVLVGPPGSGKSTLSLQYLSTYINQDTQGKEIHMQMYMEALERGENIVVDRMNFSKEQRARYIVPARERGYGIRIVCLFVPREVCLQRCIERTDHPTITSPEIAEKALNGFFKYYERPTEDECDTLQFNYYEDGDKEDCIIVDLDGTLCNINHRLHHVRGEGKKNWPEFFNGISGDDVNRWCQYFVNIYYQFENVVLCSGRPGEYRGATEEWLDENGVCYDFLFMRQAGDFRRDDVVKEIILDFEILTRFKPIFSIDDRQQVVDMWRRRGITCLQCAKGDF